MSGGQIAIVTGAAGFIGSHMVDLLIEKGYQVRGIDNLATGRLANVDAHQNNSDFDFNEIDILELSSQSPIFSQADYVFHFAGMGDIVPSIEQPEAYMTTNVMGTIRVLEAAKNAGLQKMVYAASSSCYGLAKELPTSETASIDVQYPYALSKYQGEQAVLHWGRVYGLPVNSIRIFNAYGTRSRTTGAYGAVFGVFLAQKLAGQAYTVVGDGTQRRDFVYVTDVARAFLAAAETDKINEIYNIGCGDPQSVNRLVELLGGSVTHLPKRPGEPDITWADISKIQSELGWSPQIDLSEGIQNMLENIDYWQDAPLWNPQSIQEATKAWFSALGGQEK
jgi:UDP-glucose 4-epimerase